MVILDETCFHVTRRIVGILIKITVKYRRGMTQRHDAARKFVRHASAERRTRRATSRGQFEPSLHASRSSIGSTRAAIVEYRVLFTLIPILSHDGHDTHHLLYANGYDLLNVK